MKKYTLSWGGGVNSTAIIAMIKLGMLPEYTKENSHIVFADTGAEMQYTIEHTNKVFNAMLRDGWTTTILNPQHQQEYYTPRCKNKLLPKYCLDKKIIPSRINRWCTAEYKTKPIRKYAEQHGLNTLVLGISYEEQHRAKAIYSDTTDYPLIRHRIDRKGCIELTTKAGIAPAKKSGCYFCPYQRKKQWIELYREYPKLFKKAEKVESVAKEKYKGKGYYLCRELPIREQIKKWAHMEKSNCQQQEFKEFGLNQHCFCHE